MGPCYARSVIQQELFQDEDYYFQIDSHMRFIQDWDKICIEQFRKCKSPKPILTTYASSYSLPKEYVPGEPDCAVLASSKALTILCADTFGDQNQDDPFLRIKTRMCRSDFGHVPPLALFWTARFAFSRGIVVHEVPYDPHLEYLFFGEEIGMAARLWTAGWDLFSPTKVIAYHLGSRAHRHWFRQVQTTAEKVEQERRAKYRLCGLLGTPWPQGSQLHQAPVHPYGLGSVRSLADYEKFAGVDFKLLVVNERARTGGLAAELFPPQWAEEEREKIMLSSQLKDVESWAGKGGNLAAQQQILKTQIGSTVAQSAAQQTEAEKSKAVDLARLRLQALRAQLPEGGAKVHLELSRAFVQLAQLEGSSGGSAEALRQSLVHVTAAREWEPPDDETAASWEAATLLAEASAKIAQTQFAEAKAILHKALRSVVEALAESASSAQRLAHDILEAIHIAHEKTDDRKGLETFSRSLQDLLAALPEALGAGREVPQQVPILSAADKPPDDGFAPDLKCRLLERLILIFIATGHEKDLKSVRQIYQQFRLARESPNLQKLLAMLQSSGHLLTP
eukprot:TRINITY_DN106237_c0_g1_i1.p1 TRINITY_DN106237_c0_g1~~TRINITY_DN106237_c0_g1_i1.p1  ORF type:complete len:642 (-),score=114.99 TRINITY_DN106237_c0_g1_i1:22-1716(-)